jgi:plastocyanin
MGPRYRDFVKRTLGASRSRRQVLATAAKGTLGGAGAAMLGGGISPGLLGSELAPSVWAQGVTVSIFDVGFDPPTIEVPMGTSVTWTNNGQLVNTVTSVDCGNTFDSDELDLGATFSHTFGTPGAFPYQNAANEFAMGMVTVTAGPKTYVRRNLHSLDAADTTLADYAKAVGIMKGWNEDTTPDPADAERVKNWRRSWLFQAYIHGMPLPAERSLIAELGPSPPVEKYAAALAERGWRTCEHRTHFFWPWHRMYLYWFERIVRHLSGNPEWSLPYWDYLDVEQRVLPEPFWKDRDSPLFVEARDPSLNSGAMPNLNAAAENAVFGNICDGLSQNQHELSSARLESTPHNFVHGWVGGGFAASPFTGTMGSVRTSAQDPLFMLHHANLDRLWASWRALGGPDPTDNDVWLDNDKTSGVRAPNPPWPATQMTIPYAFFDETGDKVSTIRVVKDVLDTFALGYTYDNLFTPLVRRCRPCEISPAGPEAVAFATPGAAPPAPAELGRSEPAEPIEIGPDPVTIPVTLEPAAEAVGAVVRGENVVLTIEGIQGGGVPGTFFEVYLNLPEGEEPNFASPYFVGNISLFGVQPWDQEQGHGDHMAVGEFNISPNIAALEARGEWTGDLNVTVVPYYSGTTAPAEAAAATPVAGATPAAALPTEGAWVTIADMSIARQ